MVGWLGRRAEPRVGFRRDVRVIWAGEMDGVVARAVNLSSTGILVDAPTPTACPVGSPVLCDVPLPCGALRIRGRVAHSRVLSPENVGVGIAFVDLSPRVTAELCKVIDESEEKAQPIKLRFAGTSQLLCTRALPTAEGFQFTTELPFLRSETEVDITLSPDAVIGTKGWVSAVTLDRGQHGVPRLVIGIKTVERALLPTAVDAAMSDPGEAEAGALPDRVWEARDFNATDETPPGFQRMDPEVSAPSQVTVAASSTALAEPSRDIAGPRDPDRTEIVQIRGLLPRGKRLRASVLALAASALAGIALPIALRSLSPRTSQARPISPPIVVAVNAPPPLVEPIVKPIVEPILEPILAAPQAPLVEPTSFKVGLVGSLAGAERYPLRAPDGVAFNLPKARATMALGTYNPAVRGLRAVWVRALPGGGTHLRFYYTKSRPSPEVLLQSDGVRVQDRASSS
jgi:PilZ domain